MTKDVVTLTKKMPDPLSVIAGLLSGGPDKLVGAEGEGAVVQLCDEQGRPLVSVEAPVLVQVRGEAQRLLGAVEPEVPYWWTEARATTGVEEGERLAGTFAARLATVVGGTAWPPQAARSLAVVETDGISVAPQPAAAQPAVDVLTDKVAVVIQDRPVVAMTAWLADAFKAAANAQLGLQIVTPAGTRLSPAVRAALPGWPSRWVVQDAEVGYYDGLSGAVLEWNNGLFVTATSPEATPDDPRTPVAESFTRDVADTGERQLAISYRAIHPADDRLVLGGALEAVWREITGEPPAGWGTEEPANLPWSLRQLTDVAHERSPEPTWLVVVGTPERPGLATVRITRTTGGIEEDVTLAFGYGPGEQVPTDAVPRAAEILATRHDLQSMLVQIRRARRDLSVPPRFEGPGVPFAFVLGAEEVREMPGDRARRTPLAQAPRELGPRTRPALYYPFPGDASDLSGWQDFEKLMRHLKGEQAA
ncbi:MULTISPECIES: DUF6177 family protein [Streptomyces]|uniref:Uncharacterized protein n=1 Tax=Streptomyces thermoviolaceus subsp. thermoviolaceus TaxID=66860 RepID=A0ABX0Z194_STRTL|nr:MULTISPECIES: DUF6177 family protein [Streptomyces]MCM3266506.1 DUF6177 family protein [Streptomyces thermoviolaceus]NJP17055.1 hypothetical protein [Streptomyces thermoviolaceus subsp. thermoviolaceus]RSR96221.1 hypothetical protein EF917_24100 [Streptomyces sp. WAC00469]WTD49242.1 DUF6177 family protein [Streptomyces thermoviolaceus]GGV59960.1 hypothetical protein GCM10010499_00100 [Streptomyces thermoviolaceus subsp. apingens]